MVQVKERGVGGRVLGLSLLRNQTETLSTQASHISIKQRVGLSRPLFYNSLALYIPS